jgi:dihydrodipicolinate synthase/N-acetylneuraminate lyase
MQKNLVRPVLQGVSVPLVTPFDAKGLVDHDAARELVERLIAAGVHGIMVAGTTGEGPLLTTSERMALAETVIAQVAGRIPVAAHVGAISTPETIQLARHAVSAGASTISIVCPYFFGLSEKAQVEHFCQVAGSVPQDYPVYLYNIPQRTGNNVSAAVSAAVAECCPNVVGEKDSSGDLQLLEAKLHARQPYDLIVGADLLVLSALALGARAAIVASANVIPELFVRLFDAYGTLDLLSAQKIQASINRAVRILQNDISIFKGVIACQGYPVGGVRSPLLAADSGVIRACFEQLYDEELITVRAA